MSKRKFEQQKFPEILEKIQSGCYTVKAPADTAKYTQRVTWSLMRQIYDESNELLLDFFFCSNCAKIYNLKLCNNGKTLKRHVEKCSVREQITDFFVPEMTQQQSKKIKIADKHLVKDAAMEFIIKDLRPVSSINGAGMLTFVSKITYIGAKYGHLTPEAIENAKLLPSRFTVIFFLRLFAQKKSNLQVSDNIAVLLLSISVDKTHREERQ